MPPRIYPADMGSPFVPAELERKEVPEESRVIHMWRRLRGEAPPSPGESVEGGAGEGEGTGPGAEGDEGGAPGAPETAGAAPAGEAPPPRTRHPGFEPLGKEGDRPRSAFLTLSDTTQPGADGVRTIVLEDERLAEEAAERDAARRRADLLAEAQARAEQLQAQAKEQGRQQGHAEGQKQGREEMYAELRPVVENFLRTVQEVVDYRAEVFRAAEEEIFELAVLIGKKVLHAELETHPAAVRHVVRHALDRAVGWGKATVRLHPDDCAFIEEERGHLNEEADGVVLARIEPDETITRGGCVLESNFGEVDARIELQMKEIEQTLREALSRRLEELGAPEAASPASPEAPPAAAEAAPAGGEAPGEAPGEGEAAAEVRPFQPPDLERPPAPGGEAPGEVGGDVGGEAGE